MCIIITDARAQKGLNVKDAGMYRGRWLAENPSEQDLIDWMNDPENKRKMKEFDDWVMDPARA